MKYKISLCISALCFFMAFLTALSLHVTEEEAAAARIAPKILRFHVLAESNRPEDQARKLGVKGVVLDYIQSSVPEEMEKDALKDWLLDHSSQIEAVSRQWLKAQGSDASVRFELAQDHFPTKTYGDMVFPSGTYDAARITIGEGKGRNWWCVLYPSLCFTDAVYAKVPEASKETLSALISEEDYNALMLSRSFKMKTENEPRIHVKSRLLELLSR